jgi:hypothetical protein
VFGDCVVLVVVLVGAWAQVLVGAGFWVLRLEGGGGEFGLRVVEARVAGFLGPASISHNGLDLNNS